MAIVEDNALVLRSLRYRETSRITTMLTRRFGKITVIAKGARDIKSPFGAALDPLTGAQIVFYLKKNRTLHLLRAAWVDRTFLSALTDPTGYFLASAALEFVNKILPDEDPCPEVYDILGSFLAELDEEPSNPRASVLFKAFQLRLVSLLGYSPQIEECADCGGVLGEIAGFGVAEGGLLCRSCPGRGQVLPCSPDSRRMLRAILGFVETTTDGSPLINSSERVEAVADAPHSAPLRRVDREVVAVIESFLRYHVVGYKGLRSLRCLLAWADAGPRAEMFEGSHPPEEPWPGR